MKVNALFLGRQSNIKRIFTPSIREQIHKLIHLDETVINHEQLHLPAYIEKCRQAQIVFSTWGMPEFTDEEIQKYFPKLEIIFYAAGSVQRFARPFLKSGIKVCSAAAANGIPVAEYTLAQILLANKGYFLAEQMAKVNHPSAKELHAQYPGNYGAKVGLIGMGVIGSKVAELLKPFSVEVLAYDPYLTVEKAKLLNVRSVSLDELFSTCHTISNHLPNKPEIENILDGSLFSLMQPRTTFINTGRGHQVNELELAEVLRENPTCSAVLDVTVREPLAPDSPLLPLDNVFITPHIAGSSGNEVVRMAEFMVDELSRYLQNDVLQYEVTLEELDSMA